MEKQSKKQPLTRMRKSITLYRSRSIKKKSVVKKPLVVVKVGELKEEKGKQNLQRKKVEVTKEEAVETHLIPMTKNSMLILKNPTAS